MLERLPSAAVQSVGALGISLMLYTPALDQLDVARHKVFGEHRTIERSALCRFALPWLDSA